MPITQRNSIIPIIENKVIFVLLFMVQSPYYEHFLLIHTFARPSFSSHFHRFIHIYYANNKKIPLKNALFLQKSKMFLLSNLSLSKREVPPIRHGNF